MATGAHMVMHTDILTLTQWFSPAFPVGAFSYSHGLEWMIDSGSIGDAAGLSAQIADILQFGSGRSDALFLSAAWQVGDAAALAEIDATCRAFAPSRERLLETEQQGAAFCRTVEQVWGLEIGQLTYPVSAGRAARLRAIPQVLTAAIYLQALVGNLVAVGQRLIPIGQTEGQDIIRDLAPLCQSIAEDTSSGDLSALSSTAFVADVASMKHENQYSRIFRT